MARKYNKRSLSGKSHITRIQQQQENQQFEMETLDLPGMLLRKKRLAMKLSLADVADKLKIKIDILEKIEQDDIYHDIHLTHIRGFLRKYVMFLGEDVDNFMTLIQKRKGIELERKRHDFKPPQPIGSQFSYQWLLVVLSFVIIFMLVWLWQKNFQDIAINLQQQSPPIFQTFNDQKNNDTHATENVEISRLQAIGQQKLTMVRDKKKRDNEPKKQTIIAKIIAIEDVWVVINDQNQQEIFQDILKESDVFDITDNYQEIFITTNSAGSIIYENNVGQKIPLGEKNEILDNYVIKIQ